MKSYEGGCHCGNVRFRVRTDFSRVSRCNCSMCARKCALHQRVRADEFELLAGRDALTLYQFGTRSARHYFCSTCGIFPFGHPRTAPELMVVNICCLDDFAALIDGIRIVPFDGRNWESAAGELR
jgi:hypothetical protein